MFNKICIPFKSYYNKKALFNGLLIILIVSRFGYLNYINWNYGSLTTGKGGIQYYLDSVRYIDGAEQLLNAQPLEAKQYHSVFYISLISVIKKLGICLCLLVIIQLLMALFSSWFLYDICKTVTGNSTAGIIAAGLYLTNPFIVTWHLFILTESLYTSFLIIVAWLINKSVQKHTLKFYIILFAVISIAALTRPNGWLLFPLMFGFYIVYSNYSTLFKTIVITIVIILFLSCMAFIPSVNKSIQYVPSDKTSITETLLNGVVIWDHDELRIKMPEDESMKNKNWTAACSYVVKHPVSCIKLASYRVATEVLQVRRPWYSNKYKIHIYLWIIPAYLLAIIGFFSFYKNICIKIITSLILAHILIIALTYADHESRFYIYFLPLIYLLSGCGLYAIFKRIAACKYITRQL